MQFKQRNFSITWTPGAQFGLLLVRGAAWHKFWHGLSLAFNSNIKHFARSACCLGPEVPENNNKTLPLGSIQANFHVPRLQADSQEKTHVRGGVHRQTGPKTQGKFARVLGKGVAALV